MESIEKCQQLIIKNTLAYDSNFKFESVGYLTQIISFVKLNSIKASITLIYSTLTRIKNQYLLKNGAIYPSPIIVLGNQKSGTTVIAALLSKATRKTVAIDPWFQIQNKLDIESQINLQQRLYENSSKFNNFIEQNNQYFYFEVIKEPNFTFLYEDVKKCFPEAKFIFINRDPRDNIRSILNRLKIPGNIRQLSDRQLNSMTLGWKLVMEGKYPSVPGDNYIERLAYRWNVAADNYLKNSDSMIYVTYEEFLENKKAKINLLAEEIGLKIKRDISKELDIQYQPKGNNNLSWSEFFGEENLARINDICGDKIKLFNY